MTDLAGAVYFEAAAAERQEQEFLPFKGAEGAAG